jgi:hypothetical protein
MRIVGPRNTRKDAKKGGEAVKDLGEGNACSHERKYVDL